MNAIELRQFRARHELTQDQLGEILGLRRGRGMVSKYEKGILTLSPDDARKLYRWEAAREQVGA